MTEQESGFIDPTFFYTKSEVCRRLGLGAKVWRELRQKGLPVVDLGRHQFVLGSDVMKWLQIMSQERRGGVDDA